MALDARYQAGTAWIKVEPDFRGWNRAVRKLVNEKLDNLSARVDLDTSKARAELREFESNDGSVNVNAKLDKKDLARIESQLDGLDARRRTISVNASLDNDRIRKQLAQMDKDAQKVALRPNIKLNQKSLTKEFDRLQRKMSKLGNAGEEFDAKGAKEALDSALRLDKLAGKRAEYQKKFAATQKAINESQNKANDRYIEAARKAQALEKETLKVRERLNDQIRTTTTLEEGSQKATARRATLAERESKAKGDVVEHEKALRRLDAARDRLRKRVSDNRSALGAVDKRVTDATARKSRSIASQRDVVRQGELQQRIRQDEAEIKSLSDERKGIRAAIDAAKKREKRAKDSYASEDTDARVDELRKQARAAGTQRRELERTMSNLQSKQESALADLAEAENELAGVRARNHDIAVRDLADLDNQIKKVTKSELAARRVLDRVESQLKPRSIERPSPRPVRDIQSRSNSRDVDHTRRVIDAAKSSRVATSPLTVDIQAFAAAKNSAMQLDQTIRRLATAEDDLARSTRDVATASAEVVRHRQAGTIASDEGVKAIERENDALLRYRNVSSSVTELRHKADTARNSYNQFASRLSDRIDENPIRRFADTMQHRFAGALTAVQSRLLLFGRLLSSTMAIGAAAAVGLAALGAVNMVPAIGSLTQMVGVLGIIPGLAAAAATAVAAIGVGMSGISGAFKAFGKADAATGGGGGGGADTSKAVRNAQKQVQRANEDVARTAEQGSRQIEDAERGVQDAQKQSLRAQKDLTQARKDAARQAEDLKEAVHDIALSEEDAALSIEEARERLREVSSDPDSTSTQRKRAQLSLKQAIEAQRDLRRENSRTRQEYAEAQSKGVEGSDEVVAAQERVQEATQAVSDAQRDLAQTQKDVARANADAIDRVADAQEALVDAASGGGGGGSNPIDEYNKELEKLAPNAQAFVKTAVAMKDAWTLLRKNVQQNLFHGIAADVLELGKVGLPILNRGLAETADGLNVGIRHAFTYLESTKGRADFTSIFDNSSRAAEGFSRAASNLLQALTATAEVGSRFMPWFAQILDDTARKWNNMATAGQQNGSMEKFFIRSITRAQQFGRILGDVGSIIRSTFEATSTLGNDSLLSMERGLDAYAKKMKDASHQSGVAEFFRDIRTLLHDTMDILGNVAKLLVQHLIPAFQIVNGVVGPIVQGFAAMSAWFTALPAVGGTIKWIIALLLAMKIAGSVGSAAGKIAPGTTSGIAKLRDRMRDLGTTSRATSAAVSSVGAASQRAASAGVVPLSRQVAGLRQQLSGAAANAAVANSTLRQMGGAAKQAGVGASSFRFTGPPTAQFSAFTKAVAATGPAATKVSSNLAGMGRALMASGSAAQGTTTRLGGLGKALDPTKMSTFARATSAMSVASAQARGTLPPMVRQMSALSLNTQLAARAMQGYGLAAGTNAVKAAQKQGQTIPLASRQIAANALAANNAAAAQARWAQSMSQMTSGRASVVNAARAMGALGTQTAAVSNQTAQVGRFAAAMDRLRTGVSNFGNSLRGLGSSAFQRLNSGFTTFQSGASTAFARVQSAGVTAFNGVKKAGGQVVDFLGGPVGLAITGIVIGLSLWYSHTKKLKAANDQLAATMVRVASSSKKAVESLVSSRGDVGPDVLASWTTKNEDLAQERRDKLAQAKEKDSWWYGVTHPFDQQNESGQTTFLRSNSSNSIDKKELQAQVDLLNKLKISSEDVAGAVTGTNEEWRAFSLTLVRDGSPASQQVLRDFQNQRDEFVQNQRAIRTLTPGFLDMRDALDKLANQATSTADATDALRKAFDALNPAASAQEAVSQFGELLDEIQSDIDNIDTSKGFGVDELLPNGELNLLKENARELRQYLQDGFADIGAAVRNGEDIGPLWDSYIEKMYAFGAAVGLSQQDMDKLLKSMNLTPETITTTVGVQGAGDVEKTLTNIALLASAADNNGEPRSVSFQETNPEVLNNLRAMGFEVHELTDRPGYVQINLQDNNTYARLLEIQKAIAGNSTAWNTLQENVQVGADGQVRITSNSPVVQEALKALQLQTETLPDGTIVLKADDREYYRALDAATQDRTVRVNVVPGSVDDPLIEDIDPNTGAFRVRPVPPNYRGGRIPMFALGGRMPTSGPGTERRDGFLAVGPDGVPQARVDGGEWVINAAMSEKYGALLALINADKLSGYANGGQMGGGAAQKKKQQFGIGPIGDPFAAMASGVAGLGGAFGAAVGAAAPAWQGFGQTLATTASQFITPALSGIQSQIGQLGISFPQITQMSITPPWVQMANLLSATKTSMLDPMFTGIHQGVTNLQAAFPVMSNVVGSTFLGMAGQILAAKTSTIDPAFAGIEGGLSTVEGAFGNAVNIIGSQWSQIREGTAAPVRFTINSVFNQGLVGMWNSVADLIGATKMQPYVAAFATGGYVRGEGGPTSDKIPAVLSNGEFVLNARATQAAGVDNLTRFNAANGAVGPQGLFNQRTGNMHFATGGLADPNSPVYRAMLRGHQFVKRYSGTPYGWGQSLPSDNATDCSGLQSGAADVILGGNGMRQWATGGFPGGGGTQGDTVKIGNQVWVKGLGAGHSIGVSTVHTAGTFSGIPGLPNINIESGGGTGGGTTYGGVAQGADSGQFPSRYHLAIVDGQFISGGAGGGSSPSMADLASAAMNPGFQRMLMNAQAYPGNGIIGNLPEWVATALQGPARAKIQQLAAAMTRGPAVGPGGSVERWRPMVIAALKRNGYQATDAEVTAMLAQIQSESGGNERAIQQVQDVNSGGNEAVGLLQIAAGTWPSVRDPSLADDRMDPWANMNAALRYLKMNNKDLLATWGHGHGYANGGTIPGTGWKDIFPALLTPGEEVISKAPATKFRPILKKINDGSMEAIPVVVTNWPENVALGNAVAAPVDTATGTSAVPVTVTNPDTTTAGTGSTVEVPDTTGTVTTPADTTGATTTPTDTTAPDASTPQGRTAIQDAVDAAVAAGQAQGIQTAVAVTDTSTGQNYTVNGSEVMPSASEIKLAVALAAMKKVDNGEISMEEVQPNLDPMISNSDNEATNRLIDQLGGIDAVNAEVQGMGVSSSDVTLGRKLGISFSGDDPNKMTVNGANQMLGIIQQSANGSGSISQSGANAIVNAMRNQTVDTKFGAVLPNDQIAHKTGELGGASHDVGYIFDGEKWIAVSVMTNNPNGSDQSANNEIIKTLAQQIYQNRSGGVGGVASAPAVVVPEAPVDPSQTIDPATGMPVVAATPDPSSTPARTYTPAWTDGDGMAYETDPVTGVPIDPATKKPFTKDPETGEEIVLDEATGLYKDPRTGSFFYGSTAKELDTKDGNLASNAPVTPAATAPENTFTFDDPNSTLTNGGDWVDNYSGPFSDVFKRGKLLGQLGVAAASPGALQRLGNDQEMNKQILFAKKREEALTNYKTTQEQKISELRAQGKTEEAAKLEAESRAKIAQLKEMPGTAPGTQAMLATMEKDPSVAWRKQSEQQWQQWAGENWAGIAESVGVGAATGIGNLGGGLVVNGGINTTDLSGAFRELDRRAARQSRANSRRGRR